MNYGTRKEVEARHRALARLDFEGVPTAEALIKAGFRCDPTNPKYKRRAGTYGARIRKTSRYYKDEMRRLRTASTQRIVRRQGDRREEYMERLDTVYLRCMQVVEAKPDNWQAPMNCECGKKIPYMFKFDAQNALKATEMQMIEDGMQVKQANIRHQKIDIIEGNYEEIKGRIVTLLKKTGEKFCQDVFRDLEDGGMNVRGEITVVAGSDSRRGNGAGQADTPACELLPAPPETG